MENKMLANKRRYGVYILVEVSVYIYKMFVTIGEETINI